MKSKGSAVVIARLEAEKEYHASTKIGSHFPLHAGAAGKILLAYFSEEERESYINSSLERYTATTITEPEMLRNEIAGILRQGFAVDNGERFDDIRAVACPIFNHSNEVSAAISIAFFSASNEEKKKMDLLTHLLCCGRKISRALGSMGEYPPNKASAK